MEKMKMQTGDVANENFRKLAELFPNAVTETIDENGEVVRAIDKDILMQEISTRVVEGNEERYQFTWPDKRQAMRLASTPIAATLRPCREESVNFDTTENLYIEGDNLDVLKLLRETYLGKVKMIYIDPPYNTGNDFVYDDDFAEDAGEFQFRDNQYDDQGNRLVQNTESNGRFHTDWLNMIYPRLKVAKDFLTDDGAVFISIDENELHNMQKIADEVFGPHNFIAQLVWAAGRKNDSKYISVSHEYILCYAKNIQFLKDHKILWRERKQGLDDIYAEYNRLLKQYDKDITAIEKGLKAWYKALPNGHPAKDHEHYNRVDEKGIFFADNISWPGGGGPKYEILHPVTHLPVKIPSRGWLTQKDNMEQWIKAGRVVFGEDENSVPTLKSYLKEREYAVPYSVFYLDGRASSKRLASLMGDKVFENPKDEEVISRIIDFVGCKDGDIVFDFFSGSATTAHSVFLSNLDKKANVKFILCQLQEIIDPAQATSEKSKKVALAACKLLDSLKVPHNICEIGKERIRRAGKKIKEEAGLTATNLDIGFRVLKLDSSNMEDVYYNPAETSQDDLLSQISNIKPDRTPEDLLFQVMLELGVTLSSKIEECEISGKKVFKVAGNFLIACFDENVTDEVVKAIAKEQPTYAVLRDSSFASDSVAANFEQIFATYSPDTVRRVL